MTINEKYKEFLEQNPTVLKIPFIETTKELTELIPVTYDTTSYPDTILSSHPT